MEQDPNINRGKIKYFKEVELRESEFKKASELDSSEFKNIHDEFFMKTFVFPLILFFVSAAFFAVGYAFIIQTVIVFSDAVEYALMFLVAFSAATAAYMIPRCIFSLIVVSRINKLDFWWHAGYITQRKRLWSIKFLRKDFYYIVDDEYCSQTIFDPLYRKGTEVYFLYLPGFMRYSYIGGIVVRKKE